MSDEEVQRVTDSLDAIERIEDPEARVRAKNRVMAEQVKRNKEWSAERREVILRLQREEDLSYRQIAERLGCKLSTVQDVFRNYTGSGMHRPKKGEVEAGSPRASGGNPRESLGATGTGAAPRARGGGPLDGSKGEG